MSTTFEAMMDEKMGHTAYWAGDEAAWLSEDALGVVALASEMQIAVCGVEVWLATDPGPTIPFPFIYQYAAPHRAASETWRQYVASINMKARAFIETFRWHKEDAVHQDK